MATRVPTIFLSSTFYDLRQVRADLDSFVEGQLGYRCLASEKSSFPIDPDADTIENCRRRVEEDADVLILIIGGRYGSLDPKTAKSVTNLEYLVARSQRIPIYAFVDARILPLLSVWERNPDGDFSNVVDTPRLFDFITQLRSTDRIWTVPFDSAQDVCDSLRVQMAYLTADGLSTRKRLLGRDRELDGLSGASLRLALEKPLGWAGRLFAALVDGEIESMRQRRMAYDVGIVLGSGEPLDGDRDVSLWLGASLNEGKRLWEGTMRLMDRPVNDALSAGDVRTLRVVASELGRAYAEALDWADRIRRVFVNEEWRSLLDEMSLMTGEFLSEVERFGPSLTREIDRATAIESDEVIAIDFKLTLPVANYDNFNARLSEIRRRRGLPD